MRVFDLFKIGIGPSSSHTVGPMLAARRFLQECTALEQADHLQVALYGSLALTGKGHGTDQALILGLMGETPQEIDVDNMARKVDDVGTTGQLALLGQHPISFNPATDLCWLTSESLPGHPNGMRFTLTRCDGSVQEAVYYSTGGGFIYSADELTAPAPPSAIALPYPFNSMAQLLAHGAENGLSIAALLRANERVRASEKTLEQGLEEIWPVMNNCITQGLQKTGELPGGLHVQRRAAQLWKNMRATQTAALPHQAMMKVSLYAMAVNEENAAGRRVVTAPTNGAAGIIPAVLRYYAIDCDPANATQGIRDFLLTAAAVGMLCKKNASISGAEIGCQGEVGVACGMAAAGLTAALGGNNAQIECAAEIGIEHHLGMTCDPIGGLVQIPCIERNGVAAVQAITAASLALNSDGRHMVSLDQVIETMRQTGADMQSKYKETSLGGLAIYAVVDTKFGTKAKAKANAISVKFPAC